MRKLDQLRRLLQISSVQITTAIFHTDWFIFKSQKKLIISISKNFFSTNHLMAPKYSKYTKKNLNLNLSCYFKEESAFTRLLKDYFKI